MKHIIYQPVLIAKTSIFGFWMLMWCSILFSIQYTLAQDKSNFKKIAKKLNSYAITAYPEKVYVHTDKDHYRVGETIWFKTYLVNGVTHRQSGLSNVVYVELWDDTDKLKAQRMIQMDASGGAGNIDLDASMVDGNYVLRAYTKYMLNEKEPKYFQKQITIWRNEFGGNRGAQKTENTLGSESGVIEPNITGFVGEGGPLNLEFFPEGGNFVSEAPNTIGFQIVDENGFGVPSLGNIINQNGENVLEWKSDKHGLGTFQLRPKEGDEYFAVVADSKELFKLPSHRNNQYRLQLKNNGDHLVIKVDTPVGDDTEPTMLLGHMRGNIFFKHITADRSESSYVRKLLLDKLGQGLVQFILFDSKGNVLSERLSFINNTKNLAGLQIKKTKTSYQNREKVEFLLGLKDEKLKNLNGNVSISVRKRNLEGPKKRTDIKNWFLLDSDLGQIHNDFSHFFKDNNVTHRSILDALLIGRTWEKFSWEELINPHVTEKIKYQPEKGIFISGKTTKLDNKIVPRRARVTLGIPEGSFFTQTQNTDHQGKFSFGPLAFNDSVQIVLDAVNLLAKKREESKQVGILLDTVSIPPLTKMATNRKYGFSNGAFSTAISEAKKDYQRVVKKLQLPKNVIQLKETVVQERRKVKTKREIVEERLNELTPYGRASHRLIMDSTNLKDSGRFLDVMAMMPGVQVRGNYPGQSIRLTRSLSSSAYLSTAPLFVIDGVPLNETSANFMIQTMDTFGILFVDILSGADAAYYGARGANGVIAIYTDRGNVFDFSESQYPGILSISVKGFDVPDSFPAPNYAIKKPEHSKPDYRYTLHWEPNVELSKTKEAELSFYTDDSYGEYIVEIQGMLSNGQVISEETFFVVE